jgi:hypothetical protein
MMCVEVRGSDRAALRELGTKDPYPSIELADRLYDFRTRSTVASPPNGEDNGLGTHELAKPSREGGRVRSSGAATVMGIDEQWSMDVIVAVEQIVEADFIKITWQESDRPIGSGYADDRTDRVMLDPSTASI